MKIILAGATGFIGNALVKRLLLEGHTVTVLSRRMDAMKNFPTSAVKAVLWDAHTVGEWAGELPGADAIINLAGESIAQRWTLEKKRQIKASRIEATRVIAKAVSDVDRTRRPKTWINASAVGYYGDVPKGEVIETGAKGKGFLADVCADWEEAARAAQRYDVRVVLMRFGVVLDKNGGALQKFLLPFRLFAGGPLGSGRQWFPWVHLDDVVEAIIFALDNPALSGPVNVTAPEPATMAQFCKALGKAMHRPSWAPVPAFMLKILLGEMSEMVLTGQKAVPRKLQLAGYRFQHPALGPALASLFQR